MIQGLKLEVKADELAERISGRIAYHEAKAKACEVRLKELRRLQATLEEDLDPYVASRTVELPEDVIERKLRNHAERAATLAFLRDHLVSGEMYRLDDRDLRLADLVPDD